jgi:hypothetical protein
MADSRSPEAVVHLTRKPVVTPMSRPTLHDDRLKL